MTLRQILEHYNDRYKEAKRQGKPHNEKEFVRDFLLSLSAFGLDPAEYKKALCLACGIKTPAAAWEALQREIYELYMLDIGTQEKPLIQPVWGCWLNLESRVLSAVMPIDWFSDKDDCCVWVEDYRIFGDIDWKDLVRDE